MTTTAAGRRTWLARHKALTVMLVLFTLLFGAVGGWALYVNHLIGSIPRMELELGTDTAPGGETAEASGAVNILLAGIDAGESTRIADEVQRERWVPGAHRTDTIMVFRLTADRRKAYVISIPRDTWVPIEGYGMGKINAAFSYGGPTLFARTVEQFTGLRVDHLAIVDWTGFEDLTDALGGVTIQQPGGGSLELDGEAALRYVRERYSLPRGDLDRMHRQQNFLRAASVKLRSSDTLTNPMRLTRVLGAMADHVAVDDGLTNERMRSLALSMRHLGNGDVVQATVPVERLDRISGQSVVIAEVDGARSMFGAAMADELHEYVATHQVDTLPAPASVR